MLRTQRCTELSFFGGGGGGGGGGKKYTKGCRTLWKS